MTQLTKKQAAKLLHVSETTLYRRVKAGKYTCTRTGEGQFAKLSFTYADIGLPEPAPPAPVQLLGVLVQPTITSATCGTKPPDSRTFAEKFLDGDAADSIGNKVDGTNDRFLTKGAQSLLGPIEPDHGPPVDTQAHMKAALLATNDTLGNPREATVTAEGYTRGGSPLAHGLSQETYDAMMRDWKRSGGGRSESEMEQQVRRSKSNINRSFPRG